MSKILPCPFCGKAPEAFPSGENGRGLMIECITRNCVNPHVSYYDHASAIRIWNRRDGSKTMKSLHKAIAISNTDPADKHEAM